MAMHVEPTHAVRVPEGAGTQLAEEERAAAEAGRDHTALKAAHRDATPAFGAAYLKPHAMLAMFCIGDLIEATH